MPSVEAELHERLALEIALRRELQTQLAIAQHKLRKYGIAKLGVDELERREIAREWKIRGLTIGVDALTRNRISPMRAAMMSDKELLRLRTIGKITLGRIRRSLDLAEPIR